MTFAQPVWFWALGLFPILSALFLRNEHIRRELIHKFVAAQLAKSLLIAAMLLINERRQKKEGVRFSNGRQVAIRI